MAAHSASMSPASDLRHARVAGDDPAARPRSARRRRTASPAGPSAPPGTPTAALLGIEPGDHAADVVVVAERLHERDDRRRRRTPARSRTGPAGGRSRPRRGRRRCGSRRRRGASSRAGSRARRDARAPSTSGPVSLRSRRSWMPARKSCWSRIIGERAVRPIASSTSASIEASVPCTISTRIGSIITRAPPRCRARRRAP